MGRFAQIAFTPKVKALQAARGSRAAYARVEGGPAVADTLGEDEAAFLAERDSFYMASVSESGWPYVQHRGGPKGFVRVLDEHTIGFADYRGNKQYISLGNLSHDDRAALIFVDYPHQTRLKILAHVSIVTEKDAPEMLAKLTGAKGEARVERGFILRVEGFDWNCPQFITPRFTKEEIEEALQPAAQESDALEAENRRLRAELEELTKRLEKRGP